MAVNLNLNEISSSSSSTGVDFNNVLPKAIIQSIFFELNDSELGSCRQVCTNWNNLVSDETFLKARYTEPEMAFGEAKWKAHIGDSGEVPRLPYNINEILESSCPIYEGKKIKDTHMLVYRPKQVNEKPHTINAIGKLVPIGSSATGYQYITDKITQKYGETPAIEGEWLLMTKDVLPGSRGKSFATQQQLVKDLSEKAGAPYHVPELIDAITCIFAHYIDSKKERLYGEAPLTYTRCQENIDGDPMFVGGFAPAGLSVGSICLDYVDYGIGALRKFKATTN